MHPLTTLPVAFVSDSALTALRAADRDWRVHSVFRQALNLRAGGVLVAVVPQAAGGLPNGISVSGHPDFRALGVEEGMAVAGSWPVFEVPDVGIRLELGRAWSWSPRLRVGTIDPHDPEVRRRVDAAASVVAARANKVGFGQCVALVRRTPVAASPAAETLDDRTAGAGLQAMTTLRDAVSRGDRRAALVAANRLVGLGEGLTPSGDDFLVGLTAALRAAGHPMAGEIAGHAALRAAGTTSDIARVALEHAARGEYAERVHDVLDALAHGDEPSVRAQVERALSWGASSGADMLLGVIVGLEAADTAD